MIFACRFGHQSTSYRKSSVDGCMRRHVIEDRAWLGLGAARSADVINVPPDRDADIHGDHDWVKHIFRIKVWWSVRAWGGQESGWRKLAAAGWRVLPR